MIKAERMKKKLGGGKQALVSIEDIQVRQRAAKDADGNFVGLSFDSLNDVEPLGGEEVVEGMEDETVSQAPTEVTDAGDLPGQVEEEEVEVENKEAEMPEEAPEAAADDEDMDM